MKSFKIISAGAILMMVLSIGFSTAASARDEVGKGWLVVRGSKLGSGPNSPKSYADESDAGNGTLNDVSVLCANMNANQAQTLVNTDGTRAWGAAWASALSTAIINKGGHLYKDGLTDNPNHCVISGLTAKDLANVFSNF